MLLGFHQKSLHFHDILPLLTLYCYCDFFQGGGIGVPFNVQHVAHIDSDNVQALLQAAQDDPKLLPSFLLPAGKNDDIEKASLKGDSLISKSDLILGWATSLLIFLYYFVLLLINKLFTYLLKVQQALRTFCPKLQG